MSKMFYSVLATFAEFEADLLKGKLRGKQPKLSPRSNASSPGWLTLDHGGSR
jgi:hypothetical protein